jgi:hypothetical protein
VLFSNLDRAVPEQHRNLIDRRAGHQLRDRERMPEPVRVPANDLGQLEQLREFVFPVSDCSLYRTVRSPEEIKRV